MSNMVVQTNVMALNSHRALKGTGNDLSKASARLSSGYKINSAADDAAGLAISEKMRAQIRGLDMASKNAQDAISLIQTAEGGMQEIDNMIQRIRELVDYAANDTQENNALGTGDRQKIQDEIDQLVEEIDSMAGRVEFNKKKVIDGSFADTKTQLANSKTAYDAAALNKADAAARYSALKSELGAKPSGTSPGSGALKDLYDAQVLVDAELVATAGGTTTYMDAVNTFAGQEAIYKAAENEYNAAKTALLNVMEDCDIASAADLKDDMINPLSIATGYVGDTNASALQAAVSRYITAASTFGLDELEMSSNTLTPTMFDDWSTLVVGTNVQTSWAKSDADPQGAIGAYATNKQAFLAEKARYDGLVADRDVEQTKVDSINTMITEAQKTLNTALTNFTAADTTYTASVRADNAGARALHFQVGANSHQSLIMSIGSVKSDILGIGNGEGSTNINVVKNSGSNITATLDVLDTALSYVTTQRSKLGAAQNRLEYTIKSLDISSENLSAAESRIRDADMAKEMMKMTQANVLQQAATSMLAQANQAPQSVLQLLG